MSQTVKGRKSFIAAADLSAKRYFIVKQTSANKVNLAAAATDLEIVGTLNNKPKADEGADVILRSGGETGKVILGATVSRGDHLTTDSAGKAIKTTTANDEVIGRVLQAGVSGDLVEYMPAIYKYAIT